MAVELNCGDMLNLPTCLYQLSFSAVAVIFKVTYIVKHGGPTSLSSLRVYFLSCGALLASLMNLI